jgi:hypothetical protein
VTTPQFVQAEATKVARRLAREKPEWGTPAYDRVVNEVAQRRWRRVKLMLIATVLLACAAGFLGEWRLLWLAALSGVGTGYESFVAQMLSEVASIHERTMPGGLP